MGIKRIGIDCAPFTPRPDYYIVEVIKDTPIEALIEPENTDSRVFGAWIWSFEIDDDVWAEWHHVIVGRIERLYADGCIRGGLHTKARS